jgi:ketosteroid isomerase-like protein
MGAAISEAATTAGFDLAGFRAAVEAKDVARWAGFYHPDAEWLEYRHMDPPARPNRMVGREAIAAFIGRVADWPIALRVEAMVAAGDGVAFRLWVDRPGGRRIVEHVMLELEGGQIRRQIDVEAWDPD